MSSGSKTIIIGTTITLGAVLVPGLLLILVGWQAMAGAGLLGALSCYLASTLAGWRVALALVVPLGAEPAWPSTSPITPGLQPA